MEAYCNPDCFDETGTPTDEDCNPVTPLNSEVSSKSPDCDCDCGGFVCDAAAKCTTEPCWCDPDCGGGCVDELALEAEELAACVADGLCDTWCPTGADPDCEGSESDGKWCEPGV